MGFREEHFKAKRAHITADHSSVTTGDMPSLNNSVSGSALVEVEIEQVLSFYGKVDDKKFLVDVEMVKFKVSHLRLYTPLADPRFQ
jgi:hypothetical protein